MRRFLVVTVIFGLIFGVSVSSFAARGVLTKPISAEYDIVVSQAGDGDYETIQEALDSAEEGSTIFVKAGEYDENLYIDISGIKLIGEGPDKVKVVSSGGDSALSISDVDSIEVKGFKFVYSPEEDDKGNACVWISDSSHILFHGNIITGATFSGLELSNVNESRVYENLIEKNKQSGIFVNSGARDLLIYKNTCQENGYHGIEVSGEESAPIIFENKLTKNSESGIYAHDYAVPVIKNNVISENSHSGISVAKAASCFIFSNTLINNKEDGIYVYRNGVIKASENVIQGNGISGITLSNGVGTVVKNTLSGNTKFGLDIYAQTKEDLEEIDYRVFVSRNIIENSGYSGIGAGGELLHATIAENIIRDNTEDGILVYDKARVEIVGNLIIGSKLNAVETRKGAIAYVINNTMVKNDTGIYSHDEGYGTYIYNIVAFNKLGIKYKEDEEGRISHVMNVYWSNDETAKGIKLGDQNFEKDPGFKDAEKGNYKIKMDSEFAGWGY